MTTNWVASNNRNLDFICMHQELPWLGGKESSYNAGDTGLITGLGRSPGEGNGNPLQYSYLENPTDRGAWPTAVHGVAGVGHDLVNNHHHHICIDVCYLLFFF